MIKSRRDVVIRTVQRLIDVAKSQGKQIPQTLLYKEKTGHDGAGTMPIYHSHNNPQRESNIFSKLFTPLNSTSTLIGNVVWKNEIPNSSKTTPPLALIAEKETADCYRQQMALYDANFKFIFYYLVTGVFSTSLMSFFDFALGDLFFPFSLLFDIFLRHYCCPPRDR